MKERPQRVGEAIKADLMDLLKNEVKDPRVGFVSVVRVEVSGDLRHARVYYSVLGDETGKRETAAGLARATGYLRSQLAGRLQLRHAPELDFRLDDSIERGVKIAQILGQLGSDQQRK